MVTDLFNELSNTSNVMSKLTKNKKLALDKDRSMGKPILLERSCSALVKEITFTKFDASVDMDVRLGVDPRKANQMVSGVCYSYLMEPVKQTQGIGTCVLPIRKLMLKLPVPTDVGLDEYIEKIERWLD